MVIDGGFLLLAVACLFVTVAVSTDAAVAYLVVPPLGFSRISRIRAVDMTIRGKRMTLVAGACIAVVAQLLMITSVMDASEAKDTQRIVIAAVELTGVSAWLMLLWLRCRSRPAS